MSGATTIGQRLWPSDGPHPLAQRVDVVAYLTLWLILLFGINARQVIGVLGAIGSPALVLTMPAMLLWATGWVLPDSGLDRRPHPIRAVLLGYLCWTIFSYAVAANRPLSSLEASGIDRMMITTLALVGLALLLADGVDTMDRLETFLHRVTVAVGLLCLLGIMQAFTGLSLQFSIPGLTWNSDLLAVAGRSLFDRPAGTTLHPIEFSVIPAAMLPLAIHFMLQGKTPAIRHNMVVVVGLIGLAVPLSISRSGLLSIFVSMVVMVLAWNWRNRINAALLALAAVPILWMMVPGLVGTLISLFTNVDNDPSIQARLDRGPRIMGMIRQSPWVGQGRGTWSSEQYFLIDNQVWVTTIEEGILGILVLAALFTAGIIVAVLIKYLPGVDDRTAHLAHAVAASLCGIAVSFTTFDAFHYRILTGLMFVLIGSAGALWRLNRWRLPEPRHATPGRPAESA